MLCNRNDDNLYGSYSGGKYKSVIIAVSHDNGADHSRRNTPGGLVRIFYRIISSGEGNVEGLCEAVPEIVGGSALESNAVMHHRLDSISLFCACKLLFFGLLSGDSGDSKAIEIKLLVYAEHTSCLFPCLFLGLMHCMSLLPEELGGAEERTGRLFPTYHVYPLIIKLGKVSVGVDYILEVVAEKCLGSGANHQSFRKSILTADCNHSALGSEARYVILFLLEKALGDKHRHIDIFVSECLESGVKLLLYIFPDSVAVGADDHASLYARIVNQLCLLYYVGIPLSKINVH